MAIFKKKEKIEIGDGRLKSVGIIMDGNGRWAKARALPRSAGHVAGAKIVRETVEAFRDIGVEHMTLYAFSTENWKRPKEEVDGIMKLISGYIDTLKRDRDSYDSSIRFIGDRSPLPEDLKVKCDEIEELTKDRKTILNIALNYGGRSEIVTAVNRAIADGVSPITEETIQSYLYTADSPDPDLIIRTGGDLRISNFMIWQSAYSEIYVTDTLWPDFGREEAIKAAEEFYKRKRRYGGLDPEDK